MFKRLLSRFLLSGIILMSCSTFPATGAEVDKVIDKIQEKYRSAKTITVEFNEIARYKLTGTTTEVAGTLRMKGKDKFRLESEDQVLVNNGETLWRYNKLDEQVLIDHAKQDEQDVMLNNFLYDVKEHYFGQIIDEVKEDGVKKYVLKLTPKPSEQSYFTSIKVWVREKSWVIERLIYVDYNDNETEYIIKNTEFNPDFSNSIFTFTPPDGVQVIDLRF